MPSKAVISERLPIRRGLSEAEAALYVRVGATKLRELVKKADAPRLGVARGPVQTFAAPP